MDDTYQHFITKAHLDKFIHPDVGHAVLFPYRKGGDPCKARGTRRLGGAINFYRQRENGAFHDNLDEARKQSETLLFSSGRRTPSSLSQCIYEDAFVPSEQDRLQLAAAAAFLWCGSPVQIHNTAMHALLFFQMDLLNRLNTDEMQKTYRERYGEAAEHRLEEDRDKLLNGELVLDVGKENWRQLGFEAFQIEEVLIRLLLGMQMTVVDCNYRCFFLTSDTPVVRTYPSGHDKLDDEVWFPISYRRGILWHRRNDGIRNRLGYSGSFLYNRRVIRHAYKFIYSPLSEGWIKTAARQETFDPLFGYYGSLEKVIEGAKPAIFNGERHGEIVDIVAAMRASPKPDVVGI